MLKSCSTSYCTLESTRLFSLAHLNIIRIQDMWNIRWDEIKNPPNFNSSRFHISYFTRNSSMGRKSMEWRGEENRLHHLCIDEFFSLKSTYPRCSWCFSFHIRIFVDMKISGKFSSCKKRRWDFVDVGIRVWVKANHIKYLLIVSKHKKGFSFSHISRIARCLARWFCQFSHEQIFRLFVCWLSPWISSVGVSNICNHPMKT